MVTFRSPSVVIMVYRQHLHNTTSTVSAQHQHGLTTGESMPTCHEVLPLSAHPLLPRFARQKCWACSTLIHPQPVLSLTAHRSAAPVGWALRVPAVPQNTLLRHISLHADGVHSHSDSCPCVTSRQCGLNQMHSRAAFSRPWPSPCEPYPPRAFHRKTDQFSGISYSPSYPQSASL